METGSAVNRIPSLAISGFAFLFLPLYAGAVTPEDDRASSVETANQFADCSGFWIWMSDSFIERKPETAKYLRMLANGAKSSALYVLALQYSLDHPKGPPRTYGSFAVAIEGRIESTVTRMRALEEMEDFEGIKKMTDICQAILPAQEQAVQQMRNDFVKKAPPNTSDGR